MYVIVLWALNTVYLLVVNNGSVWNRKFYLKSPSYFYESYTNTYEFFYQNLKLLGGVSTSTQNIVGLGNFRKNYKNFIFLVEPVNYLYRVSLKWCLKKFTHTVITNLNEYFIKYMGFSKLFVLYYSKQSSNCSKIDLFDETVLVPLGEQILRKCGIGSHCSTKIQRIWRNCHENCHIFSKI